MEKIIGRVEEMVLLADVLKSRRLVLLQYMAGEGLERLFSFILILTIDWPLS